MISHLRNGKGYFRRPYDAPKYATQFEQINWGKAKPMKPKKKRKP